MSKIPPEWVKKFQDPEWQKKMQSDPDFRAKEAEAMKAAGLNNVQVLKTGASNPYSYGEWLGAPGKPTVFLYAHHDVQPVKGFENDWQSPPWTLTERAEPQPPVANRCLAPFRRHGTKTCGPARRRCGIGC